MIIDELGWEERIVKVPIPGKLYHVGIHYRGKVYEISDWDKEMDGIKLDDVVMFLEFLQPVNPQGLVFFNVLHKDKKITLLNANEKINLDANVRINVDIKRLVFLEPKKMLCNESK